MIYEYFCEKHLEFEVEQKITDDPLKECPHCLKEGIINPVKKLISKSSFILLGGGWADTSYK